MGAGVGCSSSHWNAGAPEPSAAAGHRSRQAPFSQRAPTDLAANIPRTPPSLRNRSHQGRGRICGLGDTSQRDPPPRWRDWALSSVPSPGADLEGAAWSWGRMQGLRRLADLSGVCHGEDAGGPVSLGTCRLHSPRLSTCEAPSKPGLTGRRSRKQQLHCTFKSWCALGRPRKCVQHSASRIRGHGAEFHNPRVQSGRVDLPQTDTFTLYLRSRDKTRNC